MAELFRWIFAVGRAPSGSRHTGGAKRAILTEMSADAVGTTIIKSIARLLDVASVLEPLPKKSDAEALAEDWQRVGDDLRTAMGEAERELPAQERLPEQLELVEAR